MNPDQEGRPIDRQPGLRWQCHLFSDRRRRLSKTKSEMPLILVRKLGWHAATKCRVRCRDQEDTNMQSVTS